VHKPAYQQASALTHGAKIGPQIDDVGDEHQENYCSQMSSRVARSRPSSAMADA
jgi:hypothetical protein